MPQSVGRVVISTHVLECRGEVVSASTYVRSGKSSTKRRKGASSESEVPAVLDSSTRLAKKKKKDRSWFTFHVFHYGYECCFRFGRFEC